MTSAEPTAALVPVELAAEEDHSKREWLRAIKAIYRLARNTEDTTQVFEILHALSGDNMQKTYERVAAMPEGQKLLRQRPSLNRYLDDPRYLASLPEGSLGREYLEFMTAGELTPDGLIGAQDVAREHDSEPPSATPDRFYVERRLVEQHDLWHVLSGYGMDDTGELANLWFSYGQFSQLGMGFIALMGTVDGPVELEWYRFMREAYRRGKAAKFLVATPMEELLPLPLDDVRRMLDISPPSEAHPGGVLTGDRKTDGIGRGPRRLAA